MSLSAFLTNKMISSARFRKTKRALDGGTTAASASRSGHDDDCDDSKDMSCSFCARESMPASIFVMLPVLGSKTRRAKVPYCLHCYYTTSAVRQDPSKFVSILNKDVLDRQLPQIQKLFSECFLELQQEITEESARAFQKQKKDPLAAMMLHHSSNKKRKVNHITGGPAPDPEQKKTGKASDGGFLRSVAIPDRLLKTQDQQARLHQEMIARMNKATYASSSNQEGVSSVSRSRHDGNAYPLPSTAKSMPSLNQRRKGSGKSIWNLVMDQRPGGKPQQTVIYKDATEGSEDFVSAGVRCNCGSRDVRNLGNITSRNQDVRKGEIWGTDRGNEVIVRFQCNKCGKTWNEEE
jgi:hypothetical protein